MLKEYTRFILLFLSLPMMTDTTSYRFKLQQRRPVIFFQCHFKGIISISVRTSFKRQWIHSLRVLWELMDNQCSIVLSPSKVPVQHWQPKVYYQKAKLKSQQALSFVFLQSRSSEWLPGKNLISIGHPKQSRVQHW